MVRLEELLKDPKSRKGKRVILRVRVLGRKKCDTSGSYMITRSDVVVEQGGLCVYSDPIPFRLRGKEVEAERVVEEREGKIHLSRPKVLRVYGGERDKATERPR